MATNEGFEEDPLSCGGYSQFLDSAGDIVGGGPGAGGGGGGNHLDEQSFMYSNFHSAKPPTMLCFGNNFSNNKEEKGFLERSTRVTTTTTTNHHAISGVTGTSDSSSASSSNNSSNSNSFNTKSKREQIGEAPKKTEEERRNGLDTSGGPDPVPLSGNRRTSKKSKKENPTSTTGPVKVRKEKLGERITALQQLVSPFGKTDTASVLHEAMGYIRFLHDQVQVLCSPYLQKLPSSAHLSEGECGGRRGDEAKSDLRSRGLCLVPIEYTAYVANSNGADLWSPAAMGSNSSSSKH